MFKSSSYLNGWILTAYYEARALNSLVRTSPSLTELSVLAS